MSTFLLEMQWDTKASSSLYILAKLCRRCSPMMLAACTERCSSHPSHVCCVFLPLMRLCFGCHLGHAGHPVCALWASATALAVWLHALATIQFYKCILQTPGHSYLGRPSAQLHAFCILHQVHTYQTVPFIGSFIRLYKLATGNMPASTAVVVQQQSVQSEIRLGLRTVVSLQGMTKRWFTGDAIFDRLHHSPVQL